MCTVSMTLTGCGAGTAFVLACVVHPPGNNLCNSISFIICQGNYQRGAVGHLRAGLISFKRGRCVLCFSQAAIILTIFTRLSSPYLVFSGEIGLICRAALFRWEMNLSFLLKILQEIKCFAAAVQEVWEQKETSCINAAA